ncbi:MAG: TRAP transporter large permease subunit [Clostridiales Family XIII bacterium]|jgi:Na+/H+ antiporter NhaC|nr:TRAP transporter large permease subunit [Clostridiales Family XIII bacterium]
MDGPIVLLPVIAILAIAIATRRTLFAMLCGLCIAAAILSGSASGLVSTLFNYMYKGMSNETCQWLILVIVLFGILIKLLERSRAISEFSLCASRLIRSKRQALVGTFVLGIVVFIDDYLNNLAVGTTMKGITDKHGIPRTQLGYVVNSTAAPVCVLLPLSSWAVYFSGLFEADGIVVGGSATNAYLHAIPLIFYGWFAIAVLLLQVLGVIPKIGRIKKDWKRADETGHLLPEGYDETVKSGSSDSESAGSGMSANWHNFLIPLIVMIVVALLTDTDVLMGVGAGVVVAFLLYLFQKKLKFKELLTACFDGIMSMGFVCVLSVLAFSVQSANVDLNLADFVIDSVKPFMNGGFLPAVVFLVCAVYAYTTGCFWDMAVIVTPIVLPLAQAMGVDPILAGAAVFSGAAFGSNTCLYGDGIILASQATGLRAVDLMLATLPYALIAGGATTVCYLVAGFAM